MAAHTRATARVSIGDSARAGLSGLMVEGLRLREIAHHGIGSRQLTQALGREWGARRESGPVRQMANAY